MEMRESRLSNQSVGRFDFFGQASPGLSVAIGQRMRRLQSFEELDWSRRRVLQAVEEGPKPFELRSQRRISPGCECCSTQVMTVNVADFRQYALHIELRGKAGGSI